MQSPPVMINVVKERKTYDNYNAIVAIVLGLLQILFGVASIAFNASAIAFYVEFSDIGHGIWIPVFWFIAGAFGITTFFHKNKCLIVSTMIMNILSASFNAVYIILTSFQFVFIHDEDEYECDYSYEYEDEHRCHKAVQYSMSGLMLATAVLEACVAIAAAIVCCRVICCIQANDEMTPGASKYVTVNSPFGAQSVLIPIGYHLVKEGNVRTQSGIFEHQNQLTDSRDTAPILP